MKFNPIHIIKGWWKSTVHADKASLEMSRERLAICAKCPHCVDSKFLHFIKGKVKEVNQKICDLCGCPIVEKSLVKEEHCPINKWPGDE